MKNTILTIIFTFCFVGLSAQNKQDYNYYNHKIDSLISVYSIDTLKSISEVYSLFRGADLTDKEKKKLIGKIENMFQQKKYVNLYQLGHELIRSIWRIYPDSNSHKIKQLLLEAYLQYYFYPGVNYFFIGIYDFDSHIYYSSIAKKRIKEILEGKKIEAEYEAMVMFSQSANLKYPERGWREATQIMKTQNIENEKMLQQIRDSLLMEQNIRMAKEYVEGLHIQPGLIKMIGLLDMNECIPTLKENLQTCIENNCPNSQTKAYRYAIAQLGDDEQRQYILDNLMDVFSFSKEDFLYFKDDEMVWRYIDINYGLNESYSIFSDLSIPVYVKAMDAVFPFIKNVPKELDFPGLPVMKIDDQPKWAKSFYEWLMENRDTIEFDYEGEKEWFWRW